jgi:hypothetical protein
MSFKRSKQVKVSKRHVEKQRLARDESRSRNAAAVGGRVAAPMIQSSMTARRQSSAQKGR